MEQLTEKDRIRLDRLWEDLQAAEGWCDQSCIANAIKRLLDFNRMPYWGFLQSKIAQAPSSAAPIGAVATTADTPEVVYEAKREASFACGCGRGFQSQNALNAHKRKCTHTV